MNRDTPATLLVMTRKAIQYDIGRQVNLKVNYDKVLNRTQLFQKCVSEAPFPGYFKQNAELHYPVPNKGTRKVEKTEASDIKFPP